MAQFLGGSLRPDGRFGLAVQRNLRTGFCRHVRVGPRLLGGSRKRVPKEPPGKPGGDLGLSEEPSGSRETRDRSPGVSVMEKK